MESDPGHLERCNDEGADRPAKSSQVPMARFNPWFIPTFEDSSDRPPSGFLHPVMRQRLPYCGPVAISLRVGSRFPRSGNTNHSGQPRAHRCHPWIQCQSRWIGRTFQR